MGKAQGESPSDKIIYLDRQEVAQGSKMWELSCPKDESEFKFFSSLEHTELQTTTSHSLLKLKNTFMHLFWVLLKYDHSI